MESLQELLEIHGPPGDFPPADWTVVRVQPSPAVSADKMSPNTQEDVKLWGVLLMADLRAERYGDEVNQGKTYRAPREPVLDIHQV